MTAQATHAASLLLVEERDAWAEYLQTTRYQGYNYAEIEPWAWAKLQARLRAVAARRAAVGVAC